MHKQKKEMIEINYAITSQANAMAEEVRALNEEAKQVDVNTDKTASAELALDIKKRLDIFNQDVVAFLAQLRPMFDNVCE
jgi:hypothetical protein